MVEETKLTTVLELLEENGYQVHFILPTASWFSVIAREPQVENQLAPASAFDDADGERAAGRKKR